MALAMGTLPEQADSKPRRKRGAAFKEHQRHHAAIAAKRRRRVTPGGWGVPEMDPEPSVERMAYLHELQDEAHEDRFTPTVSGLVESEIERIEHTLGRLAR